MSLFFDGETPRQIINGEGALYHGHFPLQDAEGERLGVLHYGLAQPLSDAQTQELAHYHRQLANPLRLMLRLERLQWQVRLDYLTGLGNRAYFDEALARAVEQHGRTSRGLVLLLIDLDHFKQINDTWGHPTGDQLLSDFAGLLRGVIRATDQAFRLGGDEFALVLQPATPLAWQSVWQRLTERLTHHKVQTACAIGCTPGAAHWQPGMSAHDLYREADLALYRNKHSR